MMALLSLLICAEMPVLMFSVLILSALGRLNQMQQVGNSNVQTEATWFMKIGEHVMSVKCISFTELSTVILIKVITMDGMLFPPRVTPSPRLILLYPFHLGQLEPDCSSRSPTH